jgi:hypothetical protein
MHCLFVKAPFAGWIVDGVKLIVSPAAPENHSTV